MKAPSLVLFATISTSAADACDVGEIRHFACTFDDGKSVVEICHDKTVARYAFGPPNGPPELLVTRPVTDVDLVPWPGIGRTVWEEITFRNEDHAYVVYGSIERIYPENETDEITSVISGGIVVERAGVEIAQLKCDPGSADFPWSFELFNAKEAAGQCYDQITRVWQSCRRDVDGE